MAEPNLRLRPVPEQGCCLVYRPRPPLLHALNAAGWLALSLCDGRGDRAMRRDWRAATDGLTGPGTGDAALAEALDLLASLGLIRRRTRPRAGIRKPVMSEEREAA